MEIHNTVRQSNHNIPVFSINNETLDGYDAFTKLSIHEKTYCMMGSIGLGKFTLLNNLFGWTIMRKESIRMSAVKRNHFSGFWSIS